MHTNSAGLTTEKAVCAGDFLLENEPAQLL